MVCWDRIQARPRSRLNFRIMVRKERRPSAAVGVVQWGCQRKVWAGKRVVPENIFNWGIFGKSSADTRIRARKETNCKTKPPKLR